MIKVAVMGYGVVGSGVVELIDKNNKLFEKKLGQPIEVKYILDVRDFPGDPYESKLIKDFDTLVNDPEISVVAETIGGAKVAYEFTKNWLLPMRPNCWLKPKRTGFAICLRRLSAAAFRSSIR